MGSIHLRLSLATTATLRALFKVQFAVLAPVGHTSDERLALGLDLGRCHLVDLGSIKHFLKRWLSAERFCQTCDPVSPCDVSHLAPFA
jgi:hypothetical protein